MQLKIYSCSKCVGKERDFVKYGKTKCGKQRYQCRSCKTTSVLKYTYQAYQKTINPQIVQLIKEGLGIRSIARVLRISVTTLLSRIKLISKRVKLPTITLHRSYEVDEMRTFVGNKKNLYWIVYALDKKTKDVISFSVGKRNYRTLSKVIRTVQDSKPVKVFTDSLVHYKFLIDQKVHQIRKWGTNHIERKNLSIRTHIKRLNRRTICFSRSLGILDNVLKIYFWA
ncbi:IS1 family transposase [Epilithonimonas sp.]|uniref:IS1 family transposase n=1 Tax=Epilithonimonas sp. TaxID=2894511 RepID=UPI002896B113|nr:IS1 family transposase [Epilithonimonas sp.]